MSTCSLIVAAHGSDRDPSVNDRVLDLTRRAAALSGYESGHAAFHMGAPQFSQVLDRLEADHAVVVPLMTSDGYYCESVLPRELLKNKRYSSMLVHKTGPVGTHPAMVPLVESRSERLLTEHGVASAEATLALIGHGTERYARSRLATEELADAIASRGRFASVVTAFLDEAPPVESIAERVTTENVIIEPFLISDAYHALVDVPKRLGLSPQPIGVEPVVGRIQGRQIFCDTSVGSDDAILGVVIGRAVHGRNVLARRIAGAA